jgi:HlyD family secretion protein
MSATVDIRTKTAVNVLSLPIQAVTTRTDSAEKKSEVKKKAGDGEQENMNAVVVDEKEEKLKRQKDIPKPVECVFVYLEGKVKMKKVKSGIQDNSYIEIIDGLKEGEDIVAGPYSAVARMLKDGMNVKKSDKSKIFTVSTE